MIFPRSLICASSFPIYIETSKADDGVLRVRLRELEEEDARVQWGAGWPGLRPNPKNPTLAHKAGKSGAPGSASLLVRVDIGVPGFCLCQGRRFLETLSFFFSPACNRESCRPGALTTRRSQD